MQRQQVQTSHQRESATAEDSRVDEWGYRPALDGLRTVAVYLVVLFHAGVGSVAGGYIGVDLFFVLSGFLVTNVLVGELVAGGNVRLWRFYARRVRRLLPAASVTIVGTALLFLAVDSPVGRLDIVGDARAASLWYANWHFMNENVAYFATETMESPYLHFWSLSIEEQFYIVFPLLALVAWRFLGRRVWRVFALLAVAGVVVQVAVAGGSENAAYYATHARMFQLFTGAAVGAFLRFARPVGGRVRLRADAVAAVALLAFVVLATRLVPVTASVRGVAAALVAGLLLVGLELGRDGRTASWLARDSMRYLGQISYATYLWHWPLLVASERLLQLTPVAATAVSAVGGTALAALSMQLVERPVREGRALRERPQVAVALGVMAAVLVGLVVAPGVLHRDDRPMVTASASAAGGVTDLDPVPVPEGIDYGRIRSDRATGPTGCFEGGAVDECVIRDGGGLRVHVTGDSHAGMMLPALEVLAQSNDWHLSATTPDSCPWIDGLVAGERDDPQSERCQRRRDEAYSRIIPAFRPDVLVAMMAPRGEDASGKGLFADQDLASLQEAGRLELLAELTSPGVARLRDLAPRVVILETIPRTSQDMLACLSSTQDALTCAFDAGGQAIDDLLVREAVADLDDVDSVDLDQLACPRLPLCTAYEEEVVVRRDAHHLSTEWIRHKVRDVAALLEQTGAFGEVAVPDPVS